MKTMSEEAELRMCDEDFGSEEEEGDVESYLEDNSSELMDRLRELEAENSALMLANESQREAYERCLDEVANHVVQALLNQKDLREECIKLKMLVFDLERQNRALCELFQQKLPNQQPAHCQVQAGPLPDCGASLHQDAAKQAEPPNTEAPAKGNGYRAPHAASPSSLEALSPFLRKKAHILEVLRRMEESDPLKFHPSSTSTSSSSSAAAALTFCDYSQVLVSTEAVLAAAAAAAATAATTAASEPLPLQRAHRHCSCSEGDTHQLNGSSISDPAPSATAAKPCSHHTCCPSTATPQGHAPPLEGVEPENCEKASAVVCPAPEATAAAATTAQHCDLDTASPADPDQDQDQDLDPRAGASVSPAPASCLSEVKAAAISSPSKLLKFLKLPSLAERRPPAPSASSSSPPAPPSRLSPQLTRTSRIPCRTNNYEVYHSPVPARRAATAERCRPPPPPPCRSESYPAPHSAPTSPPPPPPEDVGTRTPATATVSAPTYENIPNDVIALPSAVNRKLVKSLPDSVLSPALPQRRPASSPSSSSSTSEDDDDSDSPVWVSHQGLAVKEKVEGEEEEEGPPTTPAPPPPPPPPPARRSGDSSSSSSIPKRPTGAVARPQLDSGHHAFQDRLAALGKLRGCDDLKGAPRSAGASSSEEPRQPEAAAAVAVAAAGGGGRVRGSGLKVPSGPRVGPPSPNADAPQVLRSNIRGPTSLHLKTAPPATSSSSSPNKIPPKSPSRPPTHHRAPRNPPEAPRYSSRSEERVKVGGKGRKNPVYGDSLPPPPPRPPPPEVGGPPAPVTVPATPTAMEQKVMKGIEENMLKLQEQDRGAAPGSEVKHKTSNGIASWFGLKKSKLPALSRRAAKDDKKEWRINIPSVGGPRKEGVEGLNISTLMEKAEGLRRALEEERAYVERSGRGHSCEVVLDQSQGQLAVMYRGGGGGGGVGGGSRSDNFMQQLLNRVDGKEVLHLPQRRLSFDCKASKFSQQGDILGLEKSSGRISKITSEENLSESVHSQRFAGSGASTYTLDSGIGTFPLPDCSGAAATRGLSKMRGGAEHSGSPGRAGRRARTLDRELPVQEERNSAYKQPGAGFQHGPAAAVVMREDKDAQGTNMFSQRTKTWTFPNLKAPAGPAEVYLAVEEEEEEPVSFDSPFRAGLKASGPPSSSLPVPSQGPGLSRRGKTRGPSVPEVSREAGLELLRERPEEALSPSRPQVLETPESLSDSLYDSLSSCGSQG